MVKFECTKKQFFSEGDAILFQQIQIGNFKPFYVYLCPHCLHYHISTKGISHKTLERMAEIIQNGESIKVKTISNKTAIHLVEDRIGTFLVKYKKGKKEVEILNQLYI